MYIKLTNSQKRTAELGLLSLTRTKTTKKIVRRCDGNFEPERQAIIARKPDWKRGLTNITEALLKGDPEIDLDQIGKPVTVRSTVYLDEMRQPVAHFHVLEERLTPAGEVKETKPYKVTEPNIDLPVQLSPKGGQSVAEMVAKFVVHKIYQVIHLDSLGFDFLFNLCQEIQCVGFVRVGGGVQGNGPLILRREGLPTFGYLRGQVEGDKYCCTLHLTYQELKAP